MSYRIRVSVIGAVCLLSLAAVAPVTAECVITGEITAEEVGHDLGAWQYTMTLTWDTGSVYGLSHFNLLLDDGLGACSCTDFIDALAWETPAGSSDGYPEGCTVEYEAMIECNGDPSIPDVEGFLLKFEPDESGGCEPGPAGEGTFVFFSDLEPAPIAADNLFLVDKHAQLACTGMITGVFPALECNPIPADAATWGTVKQSYSR